MTESRKNFRVPDSHQILERTRTQTHELVSTDRLCQQLFLHFNTAWIRRRIIKRGTSEGPIGLHKRRRAGFEPRPCSNRHASWPASWSCQSRRRCRRICDHEIDVTGSNPVIDSKYSHSDIWLLLGKFEFDLISLARFSFRHPQRQQSLSRVTT